MICISGDQSKKPLAQLVSVQIYCSGYLTIAEENKLKKKGHYKIAHCTFKMQKHSTDTQVSIALHDNNRIHKTGFVPVGSCKILTSDKMAS